MSDPGGATRRRAAFAAIVAVCILVGGGFVAYAALRGGREPADRAPTARQADELRAIEARPPYVVLRSLDRVRPRNYGRVAVAAVADPVRPRALTGLRCDRVAFNGRVGLCARRGGTFGTGTEATIFGPGFRPGRRLELAGVPSRTRVSPDGRYGTVTTFVSGHSYAEAGAFSTATTLLDLRRGRRVANLERFTVTRDGQPVTAPDRNYWGVTFARDGRTFYATLGTGGRTWLVRGDIPTRTGRTVHENAECPSLSPDGRLVAYKKRIGNPPQWRFTVLDLRTGRETPLAERRPIDDQIAWLDDANVLYDNSEEIWTVPANGGGRPHRWAPSAGSPTVVG